MSIGEAGLVSIVMSVYNREAFIGQSIESMLKQSYPAFEFIIIDDGSTDATASIIRSYAQNDKRIRLISRENRGLPASLNEGIVLAKGEYIARMDDDDLSVPRRLELQVDFLKSHPEVLVVGGWAKNFGDKNNTMKVPQESGKIKTKLLFGSAFIHPTVMFRRDFFDRFGLFYDESLKKAQDYDLWIRASMVEGMEFGNIAKVLLLRQTYAPAARKEATMTQTDNTVKLQERLYARFGMAGEWEKIAPLVLDRKLVKTKEEGDRLYRFFQKLLERNDSLGLYEKETFLGLLKNRYYQLLTTSNLSCKEQYLFFKKLFPRDVRVMKLRLYRWFGR